MEIYKKYSPMKTKNNRKYFLTNHQVISDLSVFMLFMIMLCSMGPWFAWNHTVLIILTLSALFILLRFCILSPKKSQTKPYIIFLSILVYFSVYMKNLNMQIMIVFLCHILVFFFVMLMNNKEKENIVRITTTMFALIVGISIIFHILIVFCNIQFPYSIIQHVNEGYPDFRNYKFLIIPDVFPVFRFRSIFTEPGHLGTIASLILYINEYKLKKLNVFVIFVGLLLSLSLAAYVLFILGYIIYQFAIGGKLYKKAIVVISIITVLISAGFYVYTQYPDSVVTMLIINRLQYDENGDIAGNNRTTAGFDYYYKNSFLGTSKMIWGAESAIMREKFSWGNNSYKVFIFQYGLFGIISLFLFYFCMACSGKSWLLLGLFILYSASFVQRIYALWEMELFLFVGAMGFSHRAKNYIHR
jgi:hypothetical protein